MLQDEGEVHNQHQLLCSQLHLEKKILDESWNNYNEMNRNYSLQGSPKHWLGCAIYMAWKKTPNRFSTRLIASNAEGNFNLNSLLRACELQVMDFIKKCKTWIDMSQNYEKMRINIEHLERKFVVSNFLFSQMYHPIFNDVFQDPSNHAITLRPKKARYLGLSVPKLFEFGWVLYLCVKSRVPDVAEDIVNSIHLLLATFDLLFSHVLIADRRDLLNPSFPGLPEDFKERSYKPPAEPPCILDILAKRHGAITVEAYFAKSYCLKPIIDFFYKEGILKDPKQSMFNESFETNSQMVTNKYILYFQCAGEIDERLFYHDDKDVLVGQVAKETESDTPEGRTQRREFSTNSNIHVTPLSGRELVKDKEMQPKSSMAPFDTVATSVKMFCKLVDKREVVPSEALIEKLNACSESLVHNIQNLEHQMRMKFKEAVAHWPKPPECQWYSQHSKFLDHRLDLGTKLYYRILENILVKENPTDLEKLVSQEIIQKTIFACCLEITLYSFNAHRKFPWLLDVLQIEPLDFYRIIEIIVRTEDQLSRAVVKHLTLIEERVLESLAWRTASPLWTRLSESMDEPPKCDQVALPWQLTEHNPTNEGSARTPTTRVSLKDRFSSPVTKVLHKSGKLISTPSKGNVTTTAMKAPKTGSLCLFFRKFYFLAHVRMQDLCARLCIVDMELRRKIWTCFEHSIVKHTDLMKDRHLDQILMCAIYVMCRVLHTAEQPTNTTFCDILRHYRYQPQSESQVYRDVLLFSAAENTSSEESRESTGVEKRGTLIHFYNNVYIKKVETYARKYIVQEEDRNLVNTTLMLSPLPRTLSRGQNTTPSAMARRLARDRILISPLIDTVDGTCTKDEPNSYCLTVQDGPLRELDDINQQIKSNVPVEKLIKTPQINKAVKRIIIDDSSVPPGVAKKARDLIQRLNVIHGSQ